MSSEELARLWGREMVARLEKIAAAVFARYDVDFSCARRAGGYTNAVWLAGGLVLRLSVRPGNDKIRREARLAALLPPEVGYPTLVETGETDGHEWSLAREIAGHNLGESWQGLDWSERGSALRQLWKKTQAVHDMDCAVLSGLVGERAWFNSNDLVEAGARLARVAQEGILDTHQADTLREALGRHARAIAGARRVLNHGDLTPDNCIWQNGRLVSLIDFEWAVLAPAELDWNGLVKWALGPDEHSPLEPVVLELAGPVLDGAGARDRLLGYAILLELHMLNDWLDHPEGEGPMETWAPYRRLRSLADGAGGYLAPLMASPRPPF